MRNIKLFEKGTNINLIVKTVGNSCNIECSYCFEKIKNVKKSEIKPIDLEKILDSILTTCSLVFHGGEPFLIGYKKFSELLDTVKKYYPKKIISVKIQTNGILLNDQWIDLIYKKYKDLNIEIAISLDGTEEMNAYRIDKKGENTFHSVINAFKLLNKYGISAGILSVITRKSLTEVEKYLQLMDTIPNIKFIKMNALFNIVDNQLTYNSILPSEYAKFIYDVACKYIEVGLYKRIAIEPILSIIQNINGYKSKYCNYSDRKCFSYLSVYPDGKIGPCDCLSIDDFYIGNIQELNKNLNIDDYVDNYLIREDTNPLKKIIESCKNCDINDFCKGGCLSQRFYFRNSKELLLDFCNSKHYLYNKFKIYKIQGEKENDRL